MLRAESSPSFLSDGGKGRQGGRTAAFMLWQAGAPPRASEPAACGCVTSSRPLRLKRGPLEAGREQGDDGGRSIMDTK
jgi:hypothetical protein